MLVSEKTSIYFSVKLSLREISYVCAHSRPRAHLHTLMMQKLCAVGMLNAILRNHLEQLNQNVCYLYIPLQCFFT